MDAKEWARGKNPWDMVEFLGDKSERKLKLYSCACCRRVWPVFTDARSRAAIETTELWLEGAASDAELDRAAEGAYDANEESDRSSPEVAAAYLPRHVGWQTAANVAHSAASAHADRTAGLWYQTNTDEEDWDKLYAAEQSAQCKLLRDIFGSPFRPAKFDAAWRTDTALALAKQMYDSRDFGAMPILADALQDAGCTRDHVLKHCRDANQVHVRGCWVVDLVLDRE
jgi:hypothetical protein